jgi:DNA-binding transcriptional ArsR family regulator
MMVYIGMNHQAQVKLYGRVQMQAVRFNPARRRSVRSLPSPVTARTNLSFSYNVPVSIRKDAGSYKSLGHIEKKLQYCPLLTTMRQMAKYSNESFQGAVEASKALSDPGRVRILMALRGRELCVCQLIELLDLAPSTVSKHMTVLRQAGFVRSNKKGRWVYYRITDEHLVNDIVRKAVAWISEAVGRAPEITDDGKRLKQILKIDPESLCRTQEEK